MASKRSLLACVNDGCQFTTDKRPKLSQHEKRCEYKEKDCPNRHLGCNQGVICRNVESHKETCKFQHVHCPVWGCDVAIRAMEMVSHVLEVHESTKYMPGGGRHQIHSRIPKECVGLGVKRSKKQWTGFPVCIKYDPDHHFFWNFSKTGDGRFMGYVTGDVAEDFVVTITAVDNGHTFRGGVNHCSRLNPNRMNVEELDGLSIPLKTLKQVLRPDDDEPDDLVQVEFDVLITHADDEMNARANSWYEGVKVEMEEELERPAEFDLKETVTYPPYFVQSGKNFRALVSVRKDGGYGVGNETDNHHPKDEPQDGTETSAGEDVYQSNKTEVVNGSEHPEDDKSTSGFFESCDSDGDNDDLEEEQMKEDREEMKMEASYENESVDYKTFTYADSNLEPN